MIAILAVVGAKAQQISVVSESGTTKLYRTLKDAIEGAASGSVIYLPGGGFSISDSVKITKKLTIFGIGHKAQNGNADGATTINGSLWFDKNSDCSSVLGCYITGNVNIGNANAAVDNVFIKFCNLSSVNVNNENIRGTYINQNYIRSSCNFSNSSCTINNNVIHSISNVSDGYIRYNIICGSPGGRDADYSLRDIKSSLIYYNILKGRGLSSNYYGFWSPYSGENCVISNNMIVGDHYGKTIGESPIIIDAKGSDCFINVGNTYTSWNISPNSDYHFKEEYKDYENTLGIYAGSGFSDTQLAPVPYIVAKRIDEQTDASGKLNVKIRVKAGQ